ncbi:MAG: hypothetical protein AAF991_05285 [Pseudomonadota bacterium]
MNFLITKTKTRATTLIGVVAGLRGLSASLPFLLIALFATSAQADGPVGEHVKDLQAHLDEYTEEVNWLMGKVDGIVMAYQEGGLEAAKPEAVVDHWEAVKFHAAIETNYIPLYASIWQGLFAVRGAIEAEQTLSDVRNQQAALEQTLWQALGAVKMAAKVQSTGALAAPQVDEALTPVATLDVIKERLDRVVAKYAEQLTDEAVEIVQDTYLSLFEGVEGSLIEQDADLVEDLEIDFNVTLPKSLQEGESIGEVRGVVAAMHTKLERAKSLLRDAEESRSSVF